MLVALVLFLALDFTIAWWNAKAVGMCWSESKQIGGVYRVTEVIGHITASIGFTISYIYAVMLIFVCMEPIIPVMQNHRLIAPDVIINFASVMVWLAVISVGVFIWLVSFQRFWKEKNAKIETVSSFSWDLLPKENQTTWEKISEKLLSSKLESKFIGGIILCIFCTFCIGYVTTTIVLNNADKKYSLFEELQSKPTTTK